MTPSKDLCAFSWEIANRWEWRMTEGCKNLEGRSSKRWRTNLDTGRHQSIEQGPPTWYPSAPWHPPILPLVPTKPSRRWRWIYCKVRLVIGSSEWRVSHGCKVGREALHLAPTAVLAILDWQALSSLSQSSTGIYMLKKTGNPWHRGT